MKRPSSAAGLALTILAVVGSGGLAFAQEEVPFQGSLTGALTSRIPFPSPPIFLDTVEMTGTATHLGAFELVQISIVDFGTVPPTAEGVGTFVAANGDKVTANITGSSESVGPGIVLITSSATITGGTGRFARASGSFTVERLFNVVTWETIGYFEGTISVPAAGNP